MSAFFLGFLFAIGAIASVAVAWMRGASTAGTVAKGTAVAFALLAVLSFMV